MKDNRAQWAKNIQNKAVLCYLATYKSFHAIDFTSWV